MFRAAWLRAALAPVTGILRELVLVSLFINLLGLASPIFVLQVYDRVVFYSGLTTLAALAIGMTIAIIFDYILRQFRSRLVQHISLKIDVALSRALMDKLLVLPMRELESRPTAFWQGLFRDIETLRNNLSGPAALLAADLPFAFLFIALVFVIAAPVAWILLLITIGFGLLCWRSGSDLGRMIGEERRIAYSRDGLVQEFVNNRAVIKALSMGQTIRPQWEAAQATSIEHSLVRGARTDRYVNLGNFLTVGTTVLLTGVGAMAIIDQHLTMGALIATNMLTSRILSPLNQLFSTWRNYSHTRLAMKRLGEAFTMPEEREISAITMPRPMGHVTLEQVSFRFAANAPPVLDSINFKLSPGRITAIVGKNGSGKTTLLKAILGLYPASHGRVLIDHGDITQFGRADLASWIGYVPQESIMFTGSIRDNIVRAQPNADDEMILRASRLAGLHEPVIDLPDGYATQIGEAGSIMSGGMRQRIAIARALLRDPPILLFDEPTSHLDRQVEEEFRENLRDLAVDRTIVVVTHSPILLAAAHDMMVLDKGRLLAHGPAAELLGQLSGLTPGRQGAAHAPPTPAGLHPLGTIARQ